MAVFLRDSVDFGRESRTLAAIETDILYEDGASIGSIPFRAESHADRTGSMAEVRRDGVDLVDLGSVHPASVASMGSEDRDRGACIFIRVAEQDSTFEGRKEGRDRPLRSDAT